MSLEMTDATWRAMLQAESDRVRARLDFADATENIGKQIEAIVADYADTYDRKEVALGAYEACSKVRQLARALRATLATPPSTERT